MNRLSFLIAIFFLPYFCFSQAIDIIPTGSKHPIEPIGLIDGKLYAVARNGKKCLMRIYDAETHKLHNEIPICLTYGDTILNYELSFLLNGYITVVASRISERNTKLFVAFRFKENGFSEPVVIMETGVGLYKMRKINVDSYFVPVVSPNRRYVLFLSTVPGKTFSAVWSAKLFDENLHLIREARLESYINHPRINKDSYRLSNSGTLYIEDYLNRLTIYDRTGIREIELPVNAIDYSLDFLNDSTLLVYGISGQKSTGEGAFVVKITEESTISSLRVFPIDNSQHYMLKGYLHKANGDLIVLTEQRSIHRNLVEVTGATGNTHSALSITYKLEDAILITFGGNGTNWIDRITKTQSGEDYNPGADTKDSYFAFIHNDQVYVAYNAPVSSGYYSKKPRHVNAILVTVLGNQTSVKPLTNKEYTDIYPVRCKTLDTQHLLITKKSIFWIR
jgi:hypothetical protein